MPIKYYTGVGSRKAPEAITDLMSNLAVNLSNQDFCLRSGRAETSDWAFQRGAEYASNPAKTEIYVPNHNFNRCFGSQNAIDPYLDLDNYEEAEDICSTLHPLFRHLRGFAREAHIRNVYQVLGKDLGTPSELLICWSTPNPIKPDEVTGGTATAWKLARRHSIPCYNLYHKQDLDRLLSDYPCINYELF